LKTQDEPMATRAALDDDDVGLLDSDEKIRNMLARYMAEEDDQDILAALRGADTGDGACGGAGGEEDERLSDEERTLRGFQDRLRRAPTQVIRRAAPNGVPLWSVPNTNRKSGKKLWSVPDCTACGGKLGFEFQILPSILSALEVDKYANDRSTAPKNSSDDVDVDEAMTDLDELLSNGMNFGSVAVFACDNCDCPAKQSNQFCYGGEDVFLVVQESADEGTALRENKKNKNRNRAKTETSNCQQAQEQQQQPQPQQHKQQHPNDRTVSMDFFPAATMAVVEDLDDDDEFELDG
jgi:hypothetical protein